jgi:hypothetical protein
MKPGKKQGGRCLQAIGVYFHVPGNCHVLEEVLIAKANKSSMMCDTRSLE